MVLHRAQRICSTGGRANARVHAEVVDACLRHTTVRVRPTSYGANVLDANLAGRTLAILGTLSMTSATDTSFVDGTIFAGGTSMSASVVGAEHARGGTISIVGACDRFTHTANVGGWAANKIDWTRAGDAMIHHRTNCVRSAGGATFAWVDALVSGAHQMFGTLSVVAAAGLASVSAAYLVVGAFLILSAQ